MSSQVKCSFGAGDAVTIEMNRELGTWTVNSWLLVQESSYTSSILWQNSNNARETTRWTRPLQSNVVQAEVVNISNNNFDEDEDVYTDVINAHSL